MNVDDLMIRCLPIVKKHTEEIKTEQTQYNVYRLLNITNREVPMCRILADLLDPKGMHGEGAKYLKLFFEKVLHKDVPVDILDQARVYREYPVTNERRIDIVIAFSGGFIPIEVKINAGDQKSQCYDYYNYAKKKDSDTVMVYLTKHGYKPSEYSLTGENGTTIDESVLRCISFDYDILFWLSLIKEAAADEMKPMIDQFIGAVKDFIKSGEEEYSMEITQKILNSNDSLRTAMAIADSVNEAKAELMRKLFTEFESQMEPLLGKYNLVTESRSEWFHYKHQATGAFYSRADSTYPGINYVIPSIKLGGDLSLWLRIEVDYRLFCSLCVFDYAAQSDTGYEIGNQCDDISEELWDKLNQYIVLPERNKKNGWIIVWKYLPTGSDNTHDDMEKIPDFKRMNDAAIELVDDCKRKTFVAGCIKTIEDTILSLIK